MSIIINKSIIFLDSIQFLSKSLDALSGNLEDIDRKYLSSEFESIDLELLKKKDPYPYEQVTSIKKFDYPKLPPKNAYDSKLNKNKRNKSSSISNEEYNRMLDVWNILKFKTFKDYHNLYLKKDVILLTDVFEKFISSCLEYYDLDPKHQFSAPGLSFDAMLKMTKVELDKIDDPDMHLFIEEGKRGGICVAVKKYSKANNEYFEDYDSTKKRNEINYDDMNNLYGKAMMSYLPYKGFKWISIKGEHINQVLNKKDNRKHGYILKVDMYLPDELHNQQSDFPMVPEKLIVKKDMLSKQQIETMKKFNIKKVQLKS